MGFALRTGRVVAGETGARIAARRRKSGVLLIASDMDEKSAARVRAWAREVPIPVFAPLEAEALAEAAGRGRCDVLLVEDRNVARSLAKELGEASGFC
ncbi:MAG: ribosomal L7Ae/L30e/S12e/Gadd45 family protein [Candidatus Eisenbacteria bacterium]